MTEPKPIDKNGEDKGKITVRNRGEAVAKIFQTFKQAQEDNFSDLEYHGPEHPEFVREKALEFAKLIMEIDPGLVTKETLGNIAGAAEAHDSVLNVSHGEMISRFRGFYEEDLAGDSKKKMRETMEEMGITRGNEGLSAEWLLRELDRYVDVEGHAVFDEASKEEMNLGIAATLPEFDFSATISDEDFEKYFTSETLKDIDFSSYRSGVKVWQPYMTPKSPITALVIAQADLRGDLATATDVTLFQRHGDGEFRELSEGLRKRIADGVESIDSETRKKNSENILRWIKSQATFAMWQKVLFWKALEENEAINRSQKAEEIRRAFAERYNRNFDANIVGAKERYERVQKELDSGKNDLSDPDVFVSLLKEIGYRL